MSQPPNETVRDEAQALALLCARGVLSLTHAPGLVSLVEAVAGAPVAGSWWSHPAGDLIYQLVTALEEAKDVLGAKVAAGKMAFVHRRLWPALVRVATDDARTTRLVKTLTAPSRALYREVERRGELRLDGAAIRGVPSDTKSRTKARADLETSALLLSASVHTDKGRHATLLRSWAAWTPAAVAKEAKKLGLDEAHAALAAAGLKLAK